MLRSRLLMTIQKELTLKIEDLAFGGEGVARHEKQVVFVPGTLSGEKVRAVVTEEKKNFVRARLVEVLEPSPDRVAPPCPFYDECEGCSYQHAAYPAQVKYKTKQIEDLLKRIGKLENIPPVKAVPAGTLLGYRNRIKMHLEKNEKGWKAGFIGSNNKSITDIEKCLIAPESINRRLKKLREDVAKEERHFKGVWLARSDTKGEVKDFFFEKGQEHYEALPLMKEKVKGKPFLSPFQSFFQTNNEMVEKLVESVEEKLSLNKDSILVDAYCGVGLFTLLFAKKTEKAIGIEEDKRSIGCARQNAAIQHVKNADFISGTVESGLNKVLEENDREKITVLLDPPRTGCHPKVIETLGSNKVKQVIYVSCNPSTLARDAQRLEEEGYKLTGLTFVDMFPQTAHAEVVAVFEG